MIMFCFSMVANFRCVIQPTVSRYSIVANFSYVDQPTISQPVRSYSCSIMRVALVRWFIWIPIILIVTLLNSATNIVLLTLLEKWYSFSFRLTNSGDHSNSRVNEGLLSQRIKGRRTCCTLAHFNKNNSYIAHSKFYFSSCFINIT